MKKWISLLFAVSALQIQAQDAVPVSKEPRHKNVFENKYVRVLNLHIMPGDTTLFHKHEMPCVSITLHPARTGSQAIMDDKGPRVPSLDRRINFDGFYQSPRIHRVWNRDTTTYHGIDVEVLTKGGANMEPPIDLAGFTQVFDAPPVRSYRLTLNSKQQVELTRSSPMLIIGLNNTGKAMINKKMFSTEGDFLFAPSSQKLALENMQDEPYSFVIMELK